MEQLEPTNGQRSSNLNCLSSANCSLGIGIALAAIAGFGDQFNLSRHTRVAFAAVSLPCMAYRLIARRQSRAAEILNSWMEQYQIELVPFDGSPPPRSRGIEGWCQGMQQVKEKLGGPICAVVDVEREGLKLDLENLLPEGRCLILMFPDRMSSRMEIHAVVWVYWKQGNTVSGCNPFQSALPGGLTPISLQELAELADR